MPLFDAAISHLLDIMMAAAIATAPDTTDHVSDKRSFK
jgi:hypothetical protein